MRKKAKIITMATVLSILPISANAGFNCKGPLTQPQLEGLKTFFSPEFTPALKHTGGRVADLGNYYKVVSSSTYSSLANDEPQIAAEATLDSTKAGHLKRYLNENASREVPGFIATALSIFVPAAWVGISADVGIQIMNSSGSAGRAKLANIAGTVSAGGKVGVIHRITKGNNGKDYYLWNYVYSGTLNGKNFMFVLESCAADVNIG